MFIETTPSDTSLSIERSLLAERIKVDVTVNAVSDHIITPFVKALIREGYAVKRHKGGSSILSQCSICRQGYVHTMIKDGVESEHCPHCRNACNNNHGKLT